MRCYDDPASNLSRAISLNILAFLCGRVDHFWESRALEDAKGRRVGRTHRNMDKGQLLKIEGDKQNRGSILSSV